MMAQRNRSPEHIQTNRMEYPRPIFASIVGCVCSSSSKKVNGPPTQMNKRTERCHFHFDSSVLEKRRMVIINGIRTANNWINILIGFTM